MAVNPADVRLDMYAMRQVPAKPLVMFSMPMATKSANRSWPRVASQTKIRLLSGPANAPITSARKHPYRATAKPPANTPTIVITTPKIFRTSAISTSVNPRSR